MEIEKTESCPCGSNELYSSCCQPLHRGEFFAKSTEQLMRSRYSAYVKAEVDYLIDTTDPRKLDSRLRVEIEKSLYDMQWIDLEILSVRQGTETDKVGKVEFKATFRHSGELMEHHELSRFKRYKGRWYYWDAEFLK